MSERYKIWDQSKPYFITLTVVDWIDLFTANSFQMIIIDSLRFCQKEKGLAIFGYCLMSSHLHLLVRADGSIPLSDILRDFKKFTSKALSLELLKQADERKAWLECFETEGRKKGGKVKYKIWKDGNHPIEITSNRFFDQKLNYIHLNPVRAGIVRKPEDYFFSSARNYADLSNCIEIIVESRKREEIR